MDSRTDAVETQEVRLRELARRYRMHFDALPERQVAKDKIVSVGYNLQLYGTHEHPDRVRPGCPECTKVYQAMREIALWILPREERPSRYEIEPFRPALFIAAGKKGHSDGSEVRLEIKIVHRHDFLAPTDECEDRCLGEMKRKLRSIGVSEAQRGRQ